MPTPTTSSATEAVPFSNRNFVDALIAGMKWSDPSISYSFPDYDAGWSTEPDSGYGPSSGDGEPWGSFFMPLSDSDRSSFTAVLNTWSRYANLQFTQVSETQTNVGDIRAAYSYQEDLSDAQAWAYVPGSRPTAGDIWFNTFGTSADEYWAPGSYEYKTVLHESGHALGLKHPFENGFVLPDQFDSHVFTVMSYSAIENDPDSYLSYYPTTPMLMDIAAIQYLYGANLAYNSGDSIYSYDDGSTYFETIWDGGGNDTISYAGSHPVTIDLTSAHGSYIGEDVFGYRSNGDSVLVSNVWIATGTIIENASSGSGNDTLIGNEGANRLSGGSGNDTLTGGGGADFLDGGTGIDVAIYGGSRPNYSVRRNVDGTVTLTGPEGTDTLTGVERLLIGSTKVAIDIDGHGGQAYRLYQAAFNRKPDLGGLGYQMNTLDIGFSLSQVAANFIASPEFQATYGSVNDIQFVTLLYQNVLHRAPDAGGLAFHTNNLALGMPRGDVLVGFSESPENQANLIGSIANGMVYT